MPWWGIAAVLAGTFVVFALVHFVAKKKRPFKRALLSMASGLLALLGINLLSGFTHVAIPVSLLSVFTCTIGGVPGVTLLLFLRLIWQ